MRHLREAIFLAPGKSSFFLTKFAARKVPRRILHRQILAAPVISSLHALLIFGIASRLIPYQMEMDDQTPRMEAVGIFANLTSLGRRTRTRHRRMAVIAVVRKLFRPRFFLFIKRSPGSNFGVRGRVRALERGPAVAGSPRSQKAATCRRTPELLSEALEPLRVEQHLNPQRSTVRTFSQRLAGQLLCSAIREAVRVLRRI
jgi:hypothetical protein